MERTFIPLYLTFGHSVASNWGNWTTLFLVYFSVGFQSMAVFYGIWILKGTSGIKYWSMGFAILVATLALILARRLISFHNAIDMCNGNRDFKQYFFNDSLIMVLITAGFMAHMWFKKKFLNTYFKLPLPLPEDRRPK